MSFTRARPPSRILKASTKITSWTLHHGLPSIGYQRRSCLPTRDLFSFTTTTHSLADGAQLHPSIRFHLLPSSNQPAPQPQSPTHRFSQPPSSLSHSRAT